MKLKKFIIVCLLLFICILPVKAAESKDIFKLDWETEAQENVYPKEVDHLRYKEGYIIIDTYPEYNSLTYYDSRGNLIREKNFEDWPLMLETDGEYIYAFTYESVLLKLDEKLNIVKSLSIDDNLNLEEASYDLKDYGYNQISIIDEKIAILGYQQIIITDKDLNNYIEKPLNEATAKEYFPIFYYYFKGLNDNIIYNPNDISGNRLVSVGNETCDQKAMAEDESSCGDISIRYEENNEVVWTKVIEDYQEIFNIKIISNYIVGIGKTGNYKSEIFILDLEGNKVQTIKETEQYISLNKISDGFVVGAVNESGYCEIDEGGSNTSPLPFSEHTLKNQELPDCTFVKHQVYYLTFNIETKITGEGTINVVDKARSGEEITYEVTPKAGYVLDTIKVTDASGNVIEYKTNKFTMPSLDVTIEVTFKKEVLNPETKDIAIVLIAFSLLVGGIIAILNYRKVKWLK